VKQIIFHIIWKHSTYFFDTDRRLQIIDYSIPCDINPTPIGCMCYSLRSRGFGHVDCSIRRNRTLS